jgi:4-amino-4-deoxy-L-arabinose transferase-like glycosyltransferase
MIRRSNKFFSFAVFVFLSGTLCLLYCLTFRPITYEARGDFPAYIDLARQIYHLPGAPSTDLSHRSPLYSVILGLFVLVFGDTRYLVAMMVFQYVLIFLSSLLIYRIISQLTGNRYAAFIAGIAGVINLTTIFFGFMIISETLALFLFTAMTWLLIRYYHRNKPGIAVMAGLVTGLLVLARYNMIGLPAVIAVLLVTMFITRKNRAGLSAALRDISIYILGVIVVVNIWAFRNYLTYGRYELIPKHHRGQRWAVPATINPGDTVSSEFKEVLKIFLETREKLLASTGSTHYRKSSLLEYGLIERINNYFRPAVSGYLLYRDSEEELLNYYHLEKSSEGIRTLNVKLKPFYNEIAEQNKKDLRRFRVYSFLYSFKHISPTLPGDKPVNLNRLPSVILKSYKILFILLVVLTYLGSVVHIIYMLTRKGEIRNGFQWVILYGLIWYFPAVNWYANVLGDANRFRYPADMLIIGLFIALITHFYYFFLKPGKTGRHSHECER